MNKTAAGQISTVNSQNMDNKKMPTSFKTRIKNTVCHKIYGGDLKIEPAHHCKPTEAAVFIYFLIIFTVHC